MQEGIAKTFHIRIFEILLKTFHFFSNNYVFQIFWLCPCIKRKILKRTNFALKMYCFICFYSKNKLLEFSGN